MPVHCVHVYHGPVIVNANVTITNTVSQDKYGVRVLNNHVQEDCNWMKSLRTLFVFAFKLILTRTLCLTHAYTTCDSAHSLTDIERV